MSVVTALTFTWQVKPMMPTLPFCTFTRMKRLFSRMSPKAKPGCESMSIEKDPMLGGGLPSMKASAVSVQKMMRSTQNSLITWVPGGTRVARSRSTRLVTTGSRASRPLSFRRSARLSKE